MSTTQYLLTNRVSGRKSSTGPAAVALLLGACMLGSGPDPVVYYTI